MLRHLTGRRPRVAVAAAVLAVLGVVASVEAGSAGTAVAAPPGSGSTPPVIAPGTPLWTNPDSTIAVAAAGLSGQARDDALRLAAFPGATWFTGGTPAEVRAGAAQVVSRARAAGAVPVLVAYNLPLRDCGAYSAGGARTTADYVTWISALAKGIGQDPAVVILEPDGLGIVPWFTSVTGEQSWCRPAGVNPSTAAAERFRALSRAVGILDLPRTAVYLDGTHSGWLSVGDVADRLMRANVGAADGFFLNVSNFETTSRQLRFGSWVSRCLDLATRGGVAPASCPSQYGPADPADESTWQRTDDAFAALYAAKKLTPDPSRMKHFVVDTSRNGRGPWVPTTTYPAPETWCNPLDRGLGARPTTITGNPLADAFLWVKVPGESDGECHRGTAGPLDPARGVVDPAAGAWFPALARELVANASPTL
ncbi:glycoside hydrolase family 6 protein [Oryzobacter telluris]|uniref:glycoside hydrolase family 6 protein n=1 Tax=Oryzobacter telluris TaxID=3149179 RepID=UPI00370D443F